MRQIVHMDLKSPNVLLHDRNYLVAKIADLGLSRQVAEGSLLTNSGHGVHLLMCELCTSRQLISRLCMLLAVATCGRHAVGDAEY